MKGHVGDLIEVQFVPLLSALNLPKPTAQATRGVTCNEPVSAIAMARGRSAALTRGQPKEFSSDIL